MCEIGAFIVFVPIPLPVVTSPVFPSPKENAALVIVPSVSFPAAVKVME